MNQLSWNKTSLHDRLIFYENSTFWESKTEEGEKL